MGKIHDMDEYLNKMSEEAIKNDKIVKSSPDHFWCVGTIHLEFPTFDESQILDALHKAGYRTCMMADDVFAILKTEEEVNKEVIKYEDIDSADLEW